MTKELVQTEDLKSVKCLHPKPCQHCRGSVTEMASFDTVEGFLVKEMGGKKVPGFSVAIVKGSEIAWAKGFGYSNQEENIPATPETVYRVASVSKPVIATGLLQWYDKGRFSLDDPVNKLTTNVKIQTSFKEQPTVRNLLTHTSGLPVHVDPTCFDLSQTVPLEEMIRKSAIVVRPPNQEIVYANTAFNMIGYLVGLFAGEPYPNYMKKNAFDPLEMHSSAFEQTPEIRKKMATPYARKKTDEPVQAVKPWYGGSIPEKPCGSLFSTVIDLSHFLIAQINKGVYNRRRILKESTIMEMHKLQARAGASRSGYALAWKRTWHYGNLMLSHTGGNLGWTAHAALYPELRVGIVILCNLNDNSAWRPPAEEALCILTGGKLAFDPTSIRQEAIPEEWNNLVGTYTRELRNVHIKIENGNLILERGAEKAYLERLDENRYLVHAGASDGMELTFEFDQKNMAKQFDLETEVFPRLVEGKRPIDESTDLIGNWHGNFVHSYGYFTIDLRIEGKERASTTDMVGNIEYLSDFKADRGRVTGVFRSKIPPEYVGWGAEEFEAKLDLAAIEGRLEGRISFKSDIGESTVPLILSRA